MDKNSKKRLNRMQDIREELIDIRIRQNLLYTRIEQIKSWYQPDQSAIECNLNFIAIEDQKADILIQELNSLKSPVMILSDKMITIDYSDPANVKIIE